MFSLNMFSAETLCSFLEIRARLALCMFVSQLISQLICMCVCVFMCVCVCVCVAMCVICMHASVPSS